MAQPNPKLDGDILVIDDEPILRELLADWLQEAGYQVRTAPHCQAGIKALAEAPAALIVTDMLMPGPCAELAVAELKRAAPSAPLIALSGSFGSDRLSIEAVLAAGAALALPKPLRRAQLLAAVRALIGAPAAAMSETG